jgi:glycosyltransferase involved in cell wall biosynthesis
VPELKNNRFARKTWKRIEKAIVPHLKYVITVCNPIAQYFKENYDIQAKIVRNMPTRDRSNVFNEMNLHQGIDFRKDKPVLVWQGAVNVERGLEELLLAMNNINAYLYIIGDGKIITQIKQLARQLHLEGKVVFLPRMPFSQMMSLTRQATIGLSLDKNTNLNYAISLPNKVFEYISAHIPSLVSDLQEIRSAIDTYRVGEFISQITSEEIVKRVNEMLADNEKLAQYKTNTYRASEDLCWENEEQKITNLVLDILNLNS